jgi:hypothetical protein
VKGFGVVIGKDAAKEFESFDAAFTYLYKQIGIYIKEHSVTQHVVKTSKLITPEGVELLYLDACDKAREKGLIK